MRFFLKIVSATLALSVLLTSPIRAEWRLGLFLGKASTCDSDLKIEQPSSQNHLLFHDIDYTDKSFRTPLYYGLRAGYFPPNYPNFGGEIEFIHAKIYSDSEQTVRVSGVRNGESIDSTIRLGEIVQGFSMTHGLNFLFFNLVGRLSLLRNENLERVALCARLGMGPLIPHTESVIDGDRKEQYELQGPAYQLAAGTEMNIWKNVNLLFEYKYTYAKVKDARIAHGQAVTKLGTNHLVFGVGRKF
jgi:opacity protein-like surface antigen